jgi:hypothetical protein
VTIRYEIGLIDLEQVYRWKVSIGEGLTYPEHTVLEFGAKRVEAAIEVAAPTNGSHDMIDRDGTNSDGGLLHKTEGLFDIGEFKQCSAGFVVGEHDHRHVPSTRHSTSNR